jgi:hypothetical protein
MLRIPLPEDDRFALRLYSLCVSAPRSLLGRKTAQQDFSCAEGQAE